MPQKKIAVSKSGYKFDGSSLTITDPKVISQLKGKAPSGTADAAGVSISIGIG